MENISAITLMSQQDVVKGIPHSPVILPKYWATDFNEGERFEIGSLESIEENAILFQENGAKNPSNYFNCENSPLIDLNWPSYWPYFSCTTSYL